MVSGMSGHTEMISNNCMIIFCLFDRALPLPTKKNPSQLNVRAVPVIVNTSRFLYTLSLMHRESLKLLTYCLCIRMGKYCKSELRAAVGARNGFCRAV